MKKQGILGKVVALISVSTIMLCASNPKINVTSMGIKSEVKPFASIATQYKSMSTSELEKEVERLTINGNVPFEMGLELMKRWTKG